MKTTKGKRINRAAYARAWRKRNPEKQRAIHARWYRRLKRSSGRLKKYYDGIARYHRRNPDKVRKWAKKSGAKRYAMLRADPIKWAYRLRQIKKWEAVHRQRRRKQKRDYMRRIRKPNTRD